MFRTLDKEKDGRTIQASYEGKNPPYWFTINIDTTNSHMEIDADATMPVPVAVMSARKNIEPLPFAKLTELTVNADANHTDTKDAVESEAPNL